MSLRSVSVSFALCATLVAGQVPAVEIPDSCMGCRFVESADKFRACLTECLGGTQADSHADELAKPAGKTETSRVNTFQMRSQDHYEPVVTPDQKVLIDQTEWTFRIKKDDGIRFATYSSENPVVYVARAIYPGLMLVRTPDTPHLTYIVNIGPANVLGFENKTVQLTFPDGTKLEAHGESIWDNHALSFHHDDFEELFRQHHSFTITMNVAGIDTKEFKFAPHNAAIAIDWVKSDAPEPK